MQVAGEHHFYTDGACSHRIGGWSYVFVSKGVEVERHSGGQYPTTNNRMELMAVLRALVRTMRLPVSDNVIIVTDSQYAIGAVNRAIKWYACPACSRRRMDGTPSKERWITCSICRSRTPEGGWINGDIIKQIRCLVDSRPVSFRWVRGHDGDRWNTAADHEAVDARIRYSKGVITGLAKRAS